MKENRITYITDVSLITCIVSAGRGDAVIRAARDMGATGTLTYHARGVGPRERFGLLAIAVEADKEVVNILVAAEQEDIVFEAVCQAGGLDVPGTGMAYVTRLDKLATYVPKEILERVHGAGKPQ
jgi:nitrogen regulatory protein P-II 1